MIEISTTATFDRLFKNCRPPSSEKLLPKQTYFKATYSTLLFIQKSCIQSTMKSGVFELTMLTGLSSNLSAPTMPNSVTSVIITRFMTSIYLNKQCLDLAQPVTRVYVWPEISAMTESIRGISM